MEVLGIQIAKLLAAIDDEHPLPIPNETAIETMHVQRGALRDQQDDLSADTLGALAQILGNKRGGA